jgi:predicted PurR-regulated permease PerM
MVSAARGVAKAVSAAGSIRDALAALTATGGSAEGLPLVPENRAELAELLSRYGTDVLAIGSRFAAGLSRVVIDAFVYLAGVFFLLLEGEGAWQWLLAHTPLRRAHLERLGLATQETARGLLLGVGLTTAAQALVATVAYVALGVPRAWALGPLTGLASVVPLVGSALVWVPLAIAFFLAGATTKAAVLAVVGLAVIGTIDNVLRPFFSKVGSLQLHVFVLVVAIFGGLSVLGALGALLGPLVARLTVEALALYREEHLDGDA